MATERSFKDDVVLQLSTQIFGQGELFGSLMQTSKEHRIKTLNAMSEIMWEMADALVAAKFNSQCK